MNNQYFKKHNCHKKLCHKYYIKSCSKMNDSFFGITLNLMSSVIHEKLSSILNIIKPNLSNNMTAINDQYTE